MYWTTECIKLLHIQLLCTGDLCHIQGELYRDEDLRAYTASTQLTPGQVSAWYCHRARTCVTVTSLPDTGAE